MPAVTRLGDMCSGHQCWMPRANIEASTDVFANSIGVHRQGDKWPPHGPCKPHPGNLAKGSTTVFVNNKQCARIGDSVDCGSTSAQGSSNVFAG